MKLILQRRIFTDNSTIGDLYIDGNWHCFTLEDVDRKLECDGEKVQDETAIPRGTYKVIIDFSNRFKREMPHVLNVPQFEGIRIHNGNTKDHTSGCILVGSTHGEDCLFNSRATFNHLFDILEQRYDKGEQITLEVK